MNEIKTTCHYSTNPELIKYINVKQFESYGLDNSVEIVEPDGLDNGIVEPFIGNNDLLKLCGLKYSRCYDIRPLNYENFTQIDTILNTVITPNDIVITNPPYMAKNKMSTEMKLKYSSLLTKGIEDTYQIFINQLINVGVKGGLIVVPINFIVGNHGRKLYEKFKNVYDIEVLNIFEKQIFDNTTQAVVSILFHNSNLKKSIKPLIHLFKENEEILIDNDEFIEFENYFKNDCDIDLSINYNTKLKPTHITINLIDLKMYAEYCEPFLNKQSDRTRICICSSVNLENEHEIINKFNDELNKFRTKTHSLTLSSYREFSRKRLTIKQAILLLKYCICN